MKKLKIALILAFSMALTAGLAACADGEEKPGADEYTIERIRFSGSDTITLTDADTADEESALAAFNEAAAGLNLRVYANQSRNFITGAECDYDTSAVVWGEAGSYTVTATPQKNNANDITAQVNVVIDHKFGDPDPSTGVARCVHCGKTESNTQFDPDVVLEYAAFHGGYTSASTTDPDGLIKPFGTVSTSEGNKEVVTYSVGKLRKGMTISVTGTAQSDPSAGTDSWYYPILGIAMREFDPSSVSSPYSTEAYEGGASVLVRNDGWVLLNGIGDAGGRLVAGFANGSSEDYNYGSLPGASKDNTPEGYDSNSMPASAEEWKNWYVYSTGTQLYTPDYAEEQAITFTWQFREDNIIVVTNKNNTTGTSLVSYIRVPDSMGGYTFDTVLHGENVKMTFSSVKSVESDLLSSVTAQLKDTAKRVYVEGETLNLDDLDVRIAFESAPNVYAYTTDYTIQAYIGNASTPEEAQADIAPEKWTTVDSDTLLSAQWKFFRVRTIVGGTARYSYLNVGYTNFISEIAPNYVDDIVPTRITKNGNVYLNEIENMMSYGTLTYAAGSSAGGSTVITLSPSGVPDRIPADYGVDGYTHYMALRIYARDGVKFGIPTSETPNVSFVRAASGAYVDVLVYLNADTVAQNNLLIKGLQTTPVRIDLSDITLSGVTSTVDGLDNMNAVPVNKGGTVTVTYTIPGLSVDEARSNHRFASIGINDLSYQLSNSRFKWTEDSFTASSGIIMGGATASVSGSISGDAEKTVLTVVYQLPAMPALSESYPGYAALRLIYNDVTLTDIVYYGAPVEAEGTSGAVINIDGVNVWFNANGADVYYVVLGSADNVGDASVDVPSFVMNVNAGANTFEEMYDFLNVDGKIYMRNGEADYETMGQANNPFSGVVRVLGTANNSRDVDRGWIVSGSVSAISYGVSLSSDNGAQTVYYFEIVQSGVSKVYKVTYTAIEYGAGGLVIPAKTEVEEITPSSADSVTVLANDCTSVGIVAKEIASGDSAVFWYEVERVSSHKWVKIDGKHSEFRCEVCGALFADSPSATNGFATGALAEASEKGLTVSFHSQNVTSDWSSVAITTAVGNVNITLPNLDPWNLSTSSMKDAEKELANLLKGANLYPDIGGVVEDGFTPTPYTGVDAYATITLSTTAGITYYVNGEKALNYPIGSAIGNGTVEDFVKLVLSIAERAGVKVAPSGFTATDAIVQVGVLDDAGVALRYQNYQKEKLYYPTGHTWSTAENGNYGHCTSCGYLNPDHIHIYNSNQICIANGCGMVNPNHVHDYSNNGVCACGAICSHDFVNGICSVCGGELSTKDYSIAVAAFTWSTAGYLATPDGLAVSGYDVTFTAKYNNTASDAQDVWDSVNIVIKSADKKSVEYVLRQAGNDYIGGDADNWNTPNAGSTVKVPEGFDEATYNTLKRDGTLKVTVHLEDNTMTVRYDLYAAADPNTVAFTASYVITGMNEQSYYIGFAFADQAKCATNTVAVSGPVINWN